MTQSQYFSEQSRRKVRQGGARYARINDQPALEVAPGVALRPVLGKKLMLSYVAVRAHSEAPVHAHDEEQIGLVLSGSCEFELDGLRRTLCAGDAYFAPPGTPHGLRTLGEPCVVVDVFSPPRAALRALLARAEPVARAQPGVIALRTKDDVAVSSRDLEVGERVVVAGPFARRRSVLVRDRIPFGHKIAIRTIRDSAEVCKNGHVIGIAAERIAIGAHVHVHNLRSRRGGHG